MIDEGRESVNFLNVLGITTTKIIVKMGMKVREAIKVTKLNGWFFDFKTRFFPEGYD